MPIPSLRRLCPRLFLSILFLGFFIPVANATDVSGTIATNTTWSPAGNPYIVVGSVTVNSGVTLTIQPGTIIKFNGNYALTVNGILNAQGTAGSLITFTSNLATQAKGNWNQIYFTDTSVDASCIISYSKLEYAQIGIKTTKSSPKIENNLIQNNIQGIQLGYLNITNIKNNIIQNNNTGLYLFHVGTEYPKPLINLNSFINNSVSIELRNAGINTQITINAENNWWGTTDPTAIESVIYHQKDYSNMALVDFVPFLTQPPTSNLITIGNTSSTPLFINPKNSESTTIRYMLDKPANVTLKIVHADTGALVKTLFTAQPRPVGQSAEIWNGKNDANQNVPPGLYKFIMTATDALGGSGTYDPVLISGMVQVLNDQISPGFKPLEGETASISYNLYVPAKVMVKVGLGFAPLSTRTIVNGVYRDKLNNTEIWDGRDDNGNIVPPKTYYVGVWTELLPENSIVVRESSQLSVTNLRGNPYALYPVFGETAKIEYTLSQTCLVTLKILNPSGALIRTLVNNQSQSSGFNSIPWDMKDSIGKLVSQMGDYKIQMDLTSLDGNESLTRFGNIRILKQ